MELVNLVVLCQAVTGILFVLWLQ